MATSTFAELSNLFMQGVFIQGVFIRHLITYMIFIIALIYLRPSEQEMYDRCFTGLDDNTCPDGFVMNITNGEVQCYNDFCVRGYKISMTFSYFSVMLIIGLIMDFLSLIGYIVSPKIKFDTLLLPGIFYLLYMIIAVTEILAVMQGVGDYESGSYRNTQALILIILYDICNIILIILHMSISIFEFNLSKTLYELEKFNFSAKEKEPIQAESDKGELIQEESDEVESEQAENSTKE